MGPFWGPFGALLGPFGSFQSRQDEEKKVTDAWLDTVDQAERTATFKAAEKQNKALWSFQETCEFFEV